MDKIISDSNNIDVQNCAKAWKAMLSVMLLYFVKRDGVDDAELKKNLYTCFEDNKPIVKKCKYMRKMYKINIDLIGLVVKTWAK